MLKQSGFTLIELLIVIAVIGLLSSIVLVNVTSSRESARIAAGLQLSSSLKHSLGAYLVGEWSFDNNDARDDSGNGNNGTVNGATPVDGIIGRAMQFDGDDSIEVSGGSSLLSVIDGVTIEYWLNRNTDSGGYHILKKSAFGGIKDNDSGGCFWTSHVGGDDYWCFPTDDIAMGKFCSIALVWAPGNKKLYIDGRLMYEGTNRRTDNLKQVNESVYIGNSMGWHANNFQGILDEVRVYNTTLSAAEIHQHYVEGLEAHQNLVQN